MFFAGLEIDLALFRRARTGMGLRNCRLHQWLVSSFVAIVGWAGWAARRDALFEAMTFIRSFHELSNDFAPSDC